MPLLMLVALWHRPAPDAFHMHGLCCRINRGSELIVDGDIRGIAPITDCHISAPWLGLRRVEGIPATTRTGLEPGVQIHWLQSVAVAHHHPRGNAETTTLRDSEVSQIPADTDLSGIDFRR